MKRITDNIDKNKKGEGKKMKNKTFRKVIATFILGVFVAINAVPVMATEIDESIQDNVENANDEENTELEEESGIIDTTAPELKSIQLGSTSVNAPGTIEVIADATDDISGVSRIEISFVNYDDDGMWRNNCSVSLSRRRYNPETHVYENYEDGKCHGILELNGNATIGKYEINSVYVYDAAGNSVGYGKYQVKQLPETLKNLNFTVVSVPDIVTPVIESLELSAKTVEVPESINITAKMKNNIGNIRNISVWFKTPSGNEISTFLQNDGNGNYTGEIKTTPYTQAGEYKFYSISLSTENGTTIHYYGESAELTDDIRDLSYNVINNNTMDNTEPELRGIALSSDYVEVPGMIDVTVDAGDDLSGVRYASISFINQTTKEYVYANVSDEYWDSINGGYLKYGDGKLHGEIQINQYTSPGKYIVASVSVMDYADNRHEYDNPMVYTQENYEFPDFLKNITFNVINDGVSADVITSTSNTEKLLNDIKNAPDNAVIAVDMTSNQKLPKEIFEVIRGTNKTLLMNSDSIQWVFRGRDITGNAKDVDLSGAVRYFYTGTYFVGDIPAVGFDLKNNGELPGKATVRLLPSSTYRNGLGTSGLNVYYFNEDTGELQLIISNISMKNGNNIEFDITHCNEGIILVTKGTARTDSTIPEGPSTWEHKSGVEGFVYRLYNVALSRDAEEAGLADWTNRLISKQENAAQVAWGIFFSEEFQNRNYTDAQYIEMLYKTMFGRSSDNEGKRYWLDCLDNGVSREYVYHGFAESEEFSNLCNSFGVERGFITLGQYRDKNMQATGFIARLYTKMLGRKFDEDGLEYWCEKYLTQENTIEEIASHGFLHSEELANLNLSDEEFVIRMYETFLNRDPEEDGLNDWVGRLERGEVTRDTLVYGFTNSPEFGNFKAEYNLP